MRKKKLIDKIATKKFAKKCYFCNEDNYSALNCHRIIPGEKYGKYFDRNTVVLCSNCHAKVHAGLIKIDKKYYSTEGHWILHYWIENQEYWN